MPHHSAQLLLNHDSVKNAKITRRNTRIVTWAKSASRIFGGLNNSPGFNASN